MGSSTNGGDAESGCLSSCTAFDIEGASKVGDTYGWPYSMSGSVYRLASGGGIAGKDLSNNMLLDNFERDEGFRPVFLRRRAMSASWQSMQKMPCEVRAYLRFSIFRLQLRHLKQSEQNAWSPVKMARSSILLPQLLQL